jgi:class 3 adenylate cyclase/predicted ATPase
MHRSKQRKILKVVSSYLPNLLLDQIAAKKSFDPSRTVPLSGSLLLADASGFTRMSEELSQIGPQGAEELTVIFNRFFSLMLKTIFANDGDVLKFGGDSLLVFFKGEKGAFRAAATALAMQKMMRHLRSVSASCGTFPLALHVGINSGDFCALSLGDTDQRLELAILGENVNLVIRCNECAGPGEILLTENCYRKLRGSVEVSEKRGDFLQLSGLKRQPGSSLKKTMQRKTKPGYAESLLKKIVPYLPQGIYRKIEADPYGSLAESEHRRVTVIFLNLIYPDELLRNLTSKKRENSLVLNDYFKAVQEVVTSFGGVITRIDPYSVGDKVLILFGAPLAQEDDEERAIRCALKVKERLRSLRSRYHHSIDQRIGINTGYAFCGEVGSISRREYTVMGKSVNLAARLMSKAGSGQILVEDKTIQATSSRFKASRRKIQVKGLSEPVVAFQIKGAIESGLILGKEVQERKDAIPLIGRKKELAQIGRLITRVMNGKGQILSLVGEPGIGKSRLTGRLLSLCWERKFTGLLVDCQSHGFSTPLLPWTAILKRYCGIPEAVGNSEKERKLIHALKKVDMERWTPLFNDPLGLSIPENEWTKSLDGERRRQILFDTITDLLLSSTQQGVTYLILEDAHWIDQSSLDLLLYFSQKISGHPILLALVHRPELKVRELEMRENHEKIFLKELDKEDASELARLHLKVRQLPPETSRLIWDKSRGNPLYLQELIRSLRDSGHLMWREDERTYQVSQDASQVAVPDTIQDLITARIDGLDEIARKVVKTASVIGRFFSFRTLASILPYPLSEDKLKYWLGYLHKLDLVPLRGTEPDPQYMFKHALTQEVAYHLLSFAQRRDLNLKIGNYYEKRFKSSLEEKCELLAHHYEHSHDLSKAFIYLIRAGNKGKRGYSNQEAIQFFGRAEKVLGQDVRAKKVKRQIKQPSKLMSDLLEHRGEVYQLIGEYSRAEKDFLNLLHLSKKGKKRSNQIKALNHLGQAFWLRADYSTSQAYVEEARQISSSIKDDLGLANSFNNLGDINRRQGSFESALRFYKSSLKHFKKAKDGEGMARSYNNIGISYWSLGRLTEAAEYFERALRARRESGDKLGEAKTLNNLALISQDRGKLRQSLQMLGSALEIFRKIGDRRNSGYCLGNMGGIYKSQSEFSSALRAFEDSLQIFREIGDQHALTYSIGNIGDVNLKLGNLDEAKKCYDQTSTAARRLGDEELESETLSRFGEYYLLKGDGEKSEKHFKKALALAEKIKSKEFMMKALAGLTELQFNTTQYLNASENSDRLLCMAQQENTKEYMARAHLLSGMAKVLLSPAGEAEPHLREALKISTEVGFKELMYRAHLELGRLYERLADVEGKKLLMLAEDHLRRAREMLEDIAGHMEEPGLREKFLASHLPPTYSCPERDSGQTAIDL